MKEREIDWERGSEGVKERETGREGESERKGRHINGK